MIRKNLTMSSGSQYGITIALMLSLEMHTHAAVHCHGLRCLSPYSYLGGLIARAR